MPNDNYCKFEDWLMPILEQMVDEQETQVGERQPRRVGLPQLFLGGGVTWGEGGARCLLPPPSWGS